MLSTLGTRVWESRLLTKELSKRNSNCDMGKTSRVKSRLLFPQITRYKSCFLTDRAACNSGIKLNRRSGHAALISRRFDVHRHFAASASGFLPIDRSARTDPIRSELPWPKSLIAAVSSSWLSGVLDIFMPNYQNSQQAFDSFHLFLVGYSALCTAQGALNPVSCQDRGCKVQ